MPSFKVRINILADYEYVVEAKDEEEANDLANERFFEGDDANDIEIFNRETASIELLP